ncbi:MAG: hypothetical protein KAS15_00885 [Nanoarchaeota archaeon]|nr:hypothetical protein [Nanoarchaeota archaeon]
MPLYNQFQKIPLNPYWWNPATTTPKNMLNEKGIFQVSVKDQYTNSVDLYAHINQAAPLITVNTNLNDESIIVNSIAAVNDGDAIFISEGCKFYQSLVTSTSVLTINLASPLDFAFTTKAAVHIGPWNLAVDGSVTQKIAHILVPPGCEFNILQLTISITDNVVMDSAKFGGILALTNGILFRIKNGFVKNLPLVVNNIGFAEQGCDIRYDDKAPAGVYGFQAKKNYLKTNGVVLRLKGETHDQLQCIIRDDLTDLTMMNITVNGHMAQR